MKDETKVNEMDFHDETANEILEYRDANEEGHLPHTETITPGHANSYLYVIAKLQKEINEKNDIYFKECDRLTAWIEREKEKRNRDINYLTAVLEMFFESGGFTKTYTLPNGKIYKRKLPDKVVVEDAEAFKKWWINSTELANDLVKTTHKPRLNIIKEYIQDNGECPDGVEYIVGEKRFHAKPGKEL